MCLFMKGIYNMFIKINERNLMMIFFFFNKLLRGNPPLQVQYWLSDFIVTDG
jgi:hypothetical protein